MRILAAVGFQSHLLPRITEKIQEKARDAVMAEA
jgi:hypothetical protein